MATSVPRRHLITAVVALALQVPMLHALESGPRVAHVPQGTHVPQEAHVPQAERSAGAVGQVASIAP
ncbi:hypothetical protein [Streptomyces sp. NPDC058657]|uniref:hypothetical protein n=1 Tax=unclassified Streptomyces TaxID=2593676 RepID=UPI003663C7FF